jgi:hypothetical protein
MATAAHSEQPAEIRIEELEAPCLRPESAVFVVFTSIHRTLKALETACKMARPLRAKVIVVAVQVVPYALPLDKPPVPFEFVIRRLEEKAEKFPEGIQVLAYLCRDRIQALRRILSPESPVIIGVRKNFWPTRDERLARKLRRAGHNVRLVNQE